MGWFSPDWITPDSARSKLPQVVIPVVVAAVLCLISTTVRYLLDPLLVGLPFAIYTPALIVATLITGYSGGFLAIALSAVLGSWLFRGHGPVLTLDLQALAGMLVWIATATIVVVLTGLARGRMLRARRVEQQLMQVLDVADMAIWEDGPDLPAPSWGPDFCALLGLDPVTPATTARLLERVAAEDKDAVRTFLNKLRHGEPQDLLIEFRVRHTSAHDAWFQMRGRYTSPHRRRAVGSIRDITSRKKDQLQLELINSELRHRLKNVFAMAGAIAAQTVKEGGPTESVTRKINERIRALAAAQDLLLPAMASRTRITDLANVILRPMAPDGEPLILQGPDVLLPRDAVTPLALVLHELGTNAVKYGAWSQPGGTVTLLSSLSDKRSDQELTLGIEWRERGGPKPDGEVGRGFGMKVIANGIPASRVTHNLDPEGLTCTISIPLGL